MEVDKYYATKLEGTRTTPGSGVAVVGIPASGHLLLGAMPCQAFATPMAIATGNFSLTQSDSPCHLFGNYILNS